MAKLAKNIHNFSIPITLRIIFILILSPKFAKCQYYIEQNPCGVLYSENSFNGEQFPVSDHQQSVDLYEDHHASESTWNVTGSLRIESGCSLKICNETYFDGACQTLEAGSYPEFSAIPNLTIVSADMASLQCKCVKECKCEDIYMTRSSCARAYMKGGCRTCHSRYTDLDAGSNSFPEEFADKVEAFVLRKGCSLTVYSEANLKGEEQTFTNATVFEDYIDQHVRSYECECNDEDFEPRVRPARPPYYPPLVDIPDNLDGVIKLLRNQSYFHHPGLRAALKSLRNRRSSKNAYILLLGATGAGKSSTVNLLFDSPITKIGGVTSTTTDIHEFRIPIPVDELGVANSELRVVDCPGFGDTRGIEQDAKILATLDAYLSNHEELHDKIPNVILIFDKFTNNRFGGEGSEFVKMLRGYDSFRERIIDENFSNVIFVLSHFNSETKETKRRPEKKLADFKRIINEYSLLPKPILIALSENKGKEQGLPKVNGYFQLPNNEFYPRNLFEKMDLVTEKGGDLMGMGIIRTAFRDSEDFNITLKTTKLINERSPRVDYYLRILTHGLMGIEKTEISQLLEKVWAEEVDPESKQRFPYSLGYLQNALNVRNIHNMEDIPKTSAGILQLITALKHDEATKELIEKGLGLRAPAFPQNNIAGFSYNVFKDTTLPTSPFQIGELLQSDIGFKIPKILTCKFEPGTKENFNVYENMQEYLQYRLKNLGIEGNISLENFSGPIKPGFNVKEISFKNDSCSLSATREFRLFEFILNDKLDLSPEFVNTIRNLTSLNETDHENVLKWRQFFSDYGTHVVKSIFGGGVIEIQLYSDEPFNSHLTQALFDLVTFAEDMSILNVDQESSFDFNEETSNNKSVLTQGVNHTLTFLGGDIIYHTNDLTKMTIDQANKLLNNWKKSLKFNPTLLKTEMKLMPISQVVKKLGHNYTAEIEKATSLLFNSELKYNPPKRNAEVAIPLARSDTPQIHEILKSHQSAIQRLQEMIAQNQKIEKEYEKKRQEIELKRLAWEQEKEDIQNARDEAWIDRMERQQKIHQAERAEDQRRFHQQMLEAEKRHEKTLKTISDSRTCLKSGTKILMADWKERSVETLRVGDLILDKDLKPTTVLGVAYEFLMNEKFYGFDENEYFFTNNHLFVGPSNNFENKMKLYAQSLSSLYSQNPLMKYLNVSNMESEINLFHLEKSVENIQTSSVVSKRVNAFEDPKHYPMETKVYDIQVNSPTGTYFANGYVCRHEIPPVEYWPNTMSLLFRLMNAPAFEKVASFEYTLNTVSRLEQISKSIASKVNDFIDNIETEKLISEHFKQSAEQPLMTLRDVDVEESISKLFSNPSVAAFGLSFYADAGVILSPILDGENSLHLGNQRTASLQHNIFELVKREMEIEFM